jgi:uncharacterized small protein (DUF1192 family)
MAPASNWGLVLKQRIWIVLSAVLAASGALAANNSSSTSSGRRVYSWVDEQGVTHYGDQIPPEYAAQEHRVIDGHGNEVEHTPAQRTPEQVAEDDQKKLDATQRANRDHNLLSTYVSVQEIEHLRDQRIALLTDQIKVTGQFLEILNGKMNKLKVSSTRYRPYSSDPNAPQMSDQLAEDLVRLGSDIHTQEENLREKRTEEAIMSKQFESDIARFKELKGIH